MRRGVRLGVDVGTVRVGVARSDPDGLLATPVETVQRGADVASVVARITALADELEAIELIVGLPLSMRGTDTASTADARAVAALLAAGPPARPAGRRAAHDGERPVGAARLRAEHAGLASRDRPGGRGDTFAARPRRRARPRRGARRARRHEPEVALGQDPQTAGPTCVPTAGTPMPSPSCSRPARSRTARSASRTGTAAAGVAAASGRGSWPRSSCSSCSPAGRLFAAYSVYPNQVKSMFGWKDDYAGSGTGTVEVVIRPGDLGSTVADRLAAEDVTKTREAFYDLLLKTKPEPALVARHLPPRTSHERGGRARRAAGPRPPDGRRRAHPRGRHGTDDPARRSPRPPARRCPSCRPWRRTTARSACRRPRRASRATCSPRRTSSSRARRRRRC